jgi:hypothetical protein
MPRRLNRRSWPVLVALSALVVPPVTSAGQSTDDATPYVVRADHRSRKPLGLLYTPEILARLVEGGPAGSVPKRISDAISQQTPIVVMWSLPPSLFDRDEDRPASYPRPYRISIVEAGKDPRAIDRLDPVWIQQDALELQQLDTQTNFEDVGAVAAFPRAAFVPGRQVFIYTPQYVNRNKRHVSHRSPEATIEWNGSGK